jgi:hypothetical protein
MGAPILLLHSPEISKLRPATPIDVALEIHNRTRAATNPTTTKIGATTKANAGATK